MFVSCSEIIDCIIFCPKGYRMRREDWLERKSQEGDYIHHRSGLPSEKQDYPTILSDNVSTYIKQKRLLMLFRS